MLGRVSSSNIAGLFRSSISGYERGTREPPLPVLLGYARAANVYVEVLIDDNLYLPEKLPAVPKSEGLKRVSAKQSKKSVSKSRKNEFKTS